MTLPVTSSSDVILDLGRRVYRFRRLTWEDEVRVVTDKPDATRLDYVASALVAVGDRSMTYAQSLRLLKAFPIPLRDRLIIYYYGKLPDRRVWGAEVPYLAPETAVYAARVEEETEAAEAAGDDLLTRTFGKDEVDEAMDLGRRMLEGTKMAGASRPFDPDNADDQPISRRRQLPPEDDDALPDPRKQGVHNFPAVW